MIEQLINELDLFSQEGTCGSAADVWGGRLDPGAINSADFGVVPGGDAPPLNWLNSLGFNLPDGARIHSVTWKRGDDEIVIWSEYEI